MLRLQRHLVAAEVRQAGDLLREGVALAVLELDRLGRCGRVAAIDRAEVSQLRVEVVVPAANREAVSGPERRREFEPRDPTAVDRVHLAFEDALAGDSLLDRQQAAGVDPVALVIVVEDRGLQLEPVVGQQALPAALVVDQLLRVEGDLVHVAEADEAARAAALGDAAVPHAGGIRGVLEARVPGGLVPLGVVLALEALDRRVAEDPEVDREAEVDADPDVVLDVGLDVLVVADAAEQRPPVAELVLDVPVPGPRLELRVAVEVEPVSVHVAVGKRADGAGVRPVEQLAGTRPDAALTRLAGRGAEVAQQGQPEERQRRLTGRQGVRVEGGVGEVEEACVVGLVAVALEAAQDELEVAGEARRQPHLVGGLLRVAEVVRHRVGERVAVRVEERVVGTADARGAVRVGLRVLRRLAIAALVGQGQSPAGADVQIGHGHLEFRVLVAGRVVVDDIAQVVAGADELVRIAEVAVPDRRRLVRGAEEGVGEQAGRVAFRVGAGKETLGRHVAAGQLDRGARRAAVLAPGVAKVEVDRLAEIAELGRPVGVVRLVVVAAGADVGLRALALPATGRQPPAHPAVADRTADREIAALRRLVGVLGQRVHVELRGRLDRVEADRAGDRRAAAGGSLRAAGHVHALDVEEVAGLEPVDLVGVDAVDVGGDRGGLEELLVALRADAAQVQVVAVARIGRLVADLEARRERFEVVVVVHAEFDDHALVETGDGHRTAQDVFLADLALNDDLLDHGEAERELDGGHAARHLHRFARGTEALERRRRRVGAVFDTVDAEGAGGVGLRALANVVAVGVLQADRDARQGAAFAVVDRARDAAVLGRCR